MTGAALVLSAAVQLAGAVAGRCQPVHAVDRLELRQRGHPAVGGPVGDAVRPQHQLAGLLVGDRPQQLRPEPDRLRRLGHPLQRRSSRPTTRTSPTSTCPTWPAASPSCSTSTGNDGQRITNLNLNASARSARSSSARSPSGTTRPSWPPIPSWPATCRTRTIIPVYRSDASGENYLLSDYLLHQDGARLHRPPRTPSSPASPASPRPRWPVPSASAKYDIQQVHADGTPAYPVGESGSDNAANYVSALSSHGSITYVETAYAKEHHFPVASLVNASGATVQPTSLNVATALEAGPAPRRPHPGPDERLHEPAAQRLPAVGLQLPGGAVLARPGRRPARRSAPAARRGDLAVPDPARARPSGSSSASWPAPARRRWPPSGYSPLPPDPGPGGLQRHRSAQRRPAAPAAHGRQLQEPLRRRGDPAARLAGGGRCRAGLRPAAPTTGPSTTLGSGGGSPGGKGSGSGSGGSGSGGSGSNGISAAAEAAGLTPELAAQGYTVVNGHLVKKLCTTPACQFKHANSLVAATDAVADPTAGMYIGWALLVLGADPRCPRSSPCASPAGAWPPPMVTPRSRKREPTHGAPPTHPRPDHDRRPHEETTRARCPTARPPLPEAAVHGSRRPLPVDGCGSGSSWSWSPRPSRSSGPPPRSRRTRHRPGPARRVRPTATVAARSSCRARSVRPRTARPSTSQPNSNLSDGQYVFVTATNFDPTGSVRVAFCSAVGSIRRPGLPQRELGVPGPATDDGAGHQRPGDRQPDVVVVPGLLRPGRPGERPDPGERPGQLASALSPRFNCDNAANPCELVVTGEPGQGSSRGQRARPSRRPTRRSSP